MEVGQYAGRKRFERAKDMVGNMFYSARDIIRAQASTELGSIQQHRLTLEEAPTDQMKMAVLRIMAEELRHGYQMFWVLRPRQDAGRSPAIRDVAQDTMDELLAMELGNHVLDAFNIPFINFLDNVIFATVIDLVGKYQLEMQKVFSYAPMARSHGPDALRGRVPYRQRPRIPARDRADGSAQRQGDYSIEDIQKALNLWVPRGAGDVRQRARRRHRGDLRLQGRTNGTAQASTSKRCAA